MKQSTKLLSLVLALVMAFSFVGVIGNAALVKGDITYDIIDDAQLTPEQVADLALDLVDNDLLAGMDTIDLSIVGKLRLDSVDHIAEDIGELTGGFIWGIGKGLLGDVGDLNFNNIKNKKRADGDLNFIYSLLQFIADNAGILSKVAYGIGTSNGIDLGLIGSFLSLPADITDLLGDLPGFLKKTVYDLLIYGSYGYNKDSEELGTLPAEVDTFDEMLQRAVGGLLAYPQDYSYEGEGDAAVKVWDEDSLLLPSIAAYGIDAIIDPAYVNLQSKSIFQLLDIVGPFAINDLGVPALNNNLKKGLMEAVEVDFNEVDASTLPAEIKTAFEVDDNEDNDGTESYCNYIAFDKIQKASDGSWYYTTIERETIMANGAPVLDEDGNEQTKRVRKYFLANTIAANEFFGVINWDWNIKLDSDPLSAGAVFDADGNPVNIDQIDLGGLVAEYGSIAGSLNHIIGIVFENALSAEIKADFETVTGEGWNFGTNESELMWNLERVMKYLLATFGEKIFGTTSPYAHIPYATLEEMTILDIVAMIGPEFFKDVMPQLIIPQNADGSYAFHEDVQVLEFGAIVFREFISEIAPTVNYDAYIFANGADAAGGRQFAVNSAEDWFNIILNLGMDIACTYLMNITNFEDYCHTAFGAEFDLAGYIAAGGGKDPGHWQAILDTAIMWAVNYVGDGSTSVLYGFDPTKIASIGDDDDSCAAFNKLSYILNTLLPLGFVNGCTSADYDFDIGMLFDRAKKLLTEFDLCQLIGLFGRNTASSYNLMNTTNVVTQVLDLVNRILKLVFNVNLLPTTTNLNSLVTQANLKTIVNTLLTSLNSIKTSLLPNALPIVAMFIQDWGGEQQMGTPKISLGTTISATNGALTGTVDNDGSFTIANGSTGVWRGYKASATATEHTQDNQYVYTITNIAAYNYDGSASSYVNSIAKDKTALDYGESATVTFNVANVPNTETETGAIVRFEIEYTVSDEDGNVMANGAKFKDSKYTYISYNPTDANTYLNNTSKLQDNGIYSPQYVGLSTAADTIPGLTTSRVSRDYQAATNKQNGAITVNGTRTYDGISFGDASQDMPNGDSDIPLRNFDTYTEDYEYTTYNWLGIANGTAKIDVAVTNGGVDKAAFAAADKQPGSSTSWNVNVKDKDDTEIKVMTLKYYDDVALADLISLVNDENSAMRTTAEYHVSGTFYAEEVLETVDDPATEENEKVTNFTATGINPDGDPDKLVTKIDAGAAATEYSAALKEAIQAAYQVWNGQSRYDHAAVYERLRLAVNDVQYIKKTAEEIKNEGGTSIDPEVEDLITLLNNVEAQYSDTKDYTDYKMYRWNRYNDVRDEAKGIINAYRNAKPATAYDEFFPYATWINEGDLRTMVAGDPEAATILALLEKYDAEEYKIKEKELQDAKNHYAGYTSLDVAQATNLLGRIPQRLLARDGGVNTTYLATEINAAKVQIGETNNNVYTTRSWTKYINAYNEAKAVLASPTQMTAFDAKYELLTARNELVKIADEADYSELEALIAQANNALAHKDSYVNELVDFGRVLAELGYHTFKNADGDDVDIFGWSALTVNSEPYAKDEQDVIDDAARELKAALARLKFKNITITGATVTEETLVEADEEAGIAEVKANVAVIAPEMNKDAVKALFDVTEISVTDKLVTADETYSAIAKKEIGDYQFAGTDSTVTLYSTVDGVLVPVATIKLVVKADINGDGVLNVEDAFAAELTANEHAELTGVYFMAANLDTATADTIANGDYGLVVNEVLAA